MPTTTRQSLQHYLDLQYPLRLVAEPDGGYTALFPDLEGCVTQGETLDEAVEMAEDARRGWIETEYERGNEIPLPSYTEEYSGKFNVRIPPSLHASLAVAAEEEDVSLNQYVLHLLSRGDAQGRIERRLANLELEVHAIHAKLDRYQVKHLPKVSVGRTGLRMVAEDGAAYGRAA